MERVVEWAKETRLASALLLAVMEGKADVGFDGTDIVFREARSRDEMNEGTQ